MWKSALFFCDSRVNEHRKDTADLLELIPSQKKLSKYEISNILLDDIFLTALSSNLLEDLGIYYDKQYPLCVSGNLTDEFIKSLSKCIQI